MDVFQLIIIIFAGLLTTSAFAKMLIDKILRPAARLDRAMPTLLSIADEFQPNVGDSLHDKITKIEILVEERKIQSENDRENLDKFEKMLTEFMNRETEENKKLLSMITKLSEQLIRDEQIIARRLGLDIGLDLKNSLEGSSKRSDDIELDFQVHNPITDKTTETKIKLSYIDGDWKVIE